MAKCPVCDSRKGKRQCAIANGLVCSICCGTIRVEESCSNCAYYQKPKRKYNEVPSFTTNQVHASEQLTAYSNTLEGAFCIYDVENKKILKDADVVKILELLMDKYHFKDVEINCDSPFVLAGFNFVDTVIGKDLAGIEEQELVKLLSVLHYVVKKLSKTGKEYMNIIHQYAGPNAEPVKSNSDNAA
ncbi:MAG: hypothetical protein ACXWF8_02720 [Methylobacter sp.]